MFAINVNGETVWETDERVVRVGLQTSEGEQGSAGFSVDQTACNLVVEFMANDGVLNAEDLDLVTHPRNLDAKAVKKRQEELADLRATRGGSDENVQAEQLNSDALSRVPEEEPKAEKKEPAKAASK